VSGVSSGVLTPVPFYVILGSESGWEGVRAVLAPSPMLRCIAALRVTLLAFIFLLVSSPRILIDGAPDFPSVVLMSVRSCGGWGGESVQRPYLPVSAQCATRFRPRHHVGAAAAVGWRSTPPPWHHCVRSVAGGGMAGDVAADGRVLRDVSIAVVAATDGGSVAAWKKSAPG